MQPEFCNCMPWPPRARQHLLGSSLSNARHYVTGGLPGSKTEIACIGCRCVLAFIRLLIKRTAGLGPHPEPVRAMVNRYTQPTRNYTQPLGIAAMSTLSLLLPGRPLACACVGLKSGKARTSLQHRLPAETGREPGESRESNKTGVEQGDMQRKQLTGHASKRVYDWQSGMAHWGETQRYGSMGWPNGSAER